MPHLLPTLRALVIAFAGAMLAALTHWPLPWMTGSLVAVAGAGMLGMTAPAPSILARARDGGQWWIGAALGLYFTPEVVAAIAQLAPWIVLTIGFLLTLGAAGALLLRRLSGESTTTCFFAAAIGGASEMAAQAERYGGRVDRVAAAHGLRIVMVALLVPLALTWAKVHGSDPYESVGRGVDAAGLAALAAITGGAALVLRRLQVPNAWMLGPLIAAACVTGSGHVLSALPVAVIDGGQLLIGVALGARFTRAFFHAAPRFLGAVAALTLVYLGLCAAFGAWIAGHAGLITPTSILATTPGGIGEMALTAKAMHLGAPVVTAFQALRMTTVVVLIGPAYQLARRLRRRDDSDRRAR